jgi:hypothetical protein
MKVPKLTVSLIADRIWSPGGRLTKPQVIDRLRNWTKEGLLVPLGDKNPGTGRHRYYPYTALADVLLLTVLTDAIGLQAVKARAFSDLFHLAKERLKTDPGKDQLILIGLSRHGEPAKTILVRSNALQSELNASDHQVHIVIDLGKIYASLNPPGA